MQRRRHNMLNMNLHKNTLALQERHIHGEIYWCIIEQVKLRHIGWMTGNTMCFDTYRCMWFPHLMKIYGFVVRCNICSIMCETWASRFFLCHDTFAFQEGLIIDESIDASWSKCVTSQLPNPFFISCIQLEHNFLLLCLFWIFCLLPMRF